MKLPFKRRKSGYGSLLQQTKPKSQTELDDSSINVPDAMPSDESSGGSSGDRLSQPPHIVPRRSMVLLEPELQFSMAEQRETISDGTEMSPHLAFFSHATTTDEICGTGLHAAAMKRSVTQPVSILSKPHRELAAPLDKTSMNSVGYGSSHRAPIISVTTKKPSAQSIANTGRSRKPEPRIQTRKKSSSCNRSKTDPLRSRCSGPSPRTQSEILLGHLQRGGSSFSAFFRSAANDDDLFSLDTPSFWSESTIETRTQTSYSEEESSIHVEDMNADFPTESLLSSLAGILSETGCYSCTDKGAFADDGCVEYDS